MANLSDILPPSNLVTDSSTDTLTNKTLTAPKFADGGFIADANGNELIKLQTTSSAVNELEVTNAATGDAVIIGASGGDSNIDITLTPKGTGEVNIAADNLNYAGTAVTASGAELNYNDTGSSVGTVVASKVVTVDANKDVASFRNITLTGELDAGSLDVSGDADIDGTTNLDAVDIDGAVQIDNTVTVGEDDTGYDVKFFGATSGAYLLWDESADKLLTAGGTTIDIVKDKLLIGSTAVTTTAAELNILDGVTATTAELNYLDLATLGSTAASKVVSADANGVVRFTKGIVEEVVDVTSSISSNAVALDLQASTNFIVDLNGVSSALTLTFSNDPPDAGIFTVKVIQGSSAKTITWQGDVDWPGGTAPTLSSSNDAVDVFVFLTVDGGSNFYGFTAGLDVKSPS